MNRSTHIILAFSIALLLAMPVYGATNQIKVSLAWKSGKIMKWTDEAWGIAAYDANGDGVKDIIVPVSGNNVSLLDGATHKEISRFQVDKNTLLNFLFNYAFVAQMDGDENKELVLGAMGLLLGNIFVVDLTTHRVEMHISTPGGCMAVYDVDNDGMDEIITATNHVEIYRVGSSSPISKSENMSGYANAMVAASVGEKRVLFVASVKTVSVGYTEFEYHARVYGFSLPDLKVILNISAGSTNVHAIAVSDTNNDGNVEILVGSNRVTAYNMQGNVVWMSDPFGTEINNIKIADLLGNGQKYMVTASDDIEIWNLTSRKRVWQSETLYDVGEAGGLLVTKLTQNGTTEIITRAYAYSEGGRVYEYSVSAPNISGGNNTNNSTGGAGLLPPENSLMFQIILGAFAVAMAAVVVVILAKRRKKK